MTIYNHTAASDDTISTSVIVVSDRCFRGEETDISGETARQELLAQGYAARSVMLVPDDPEAIREAIHLELAAGSRLILTSGGTGVSPRDHTPEATRPLIATELPALTHALMAKALLQTPLAALSRGLAGLTEDRALIVNAAGSPHAVTCALAVILPLLPHLFSQVQQDAPPAGGYIDHRL